MSSNTVKRDKQQPINVKFFFKAPPDLDSLRTWIARERAEEVIYKIADIMRCCWSTSMCDNSSAVLIEFDKNHTIEAQKMEEFLYCLKRLGQLLATEESNNTQTTH